MADHARSNTDRDGNDYAEHEGIMSFPDADQVARRLHGRAAHSDGLFPRLTHRAGHAREAAAWRLHEVAIPAEVDRQSRASRTPDTVKKLKALAPRSWSRPSRASKPACSMRLRGGGRHDGRPRRSWSPRADVVLKVRRPAEAEIANYKSGALVISIMDPYGNDAALAAWRRPGAGFAMNCCRASPARR